DVIRMEVGINRLHQPKVEFTDELQVAVDFLEYWIDDQRLATTAARDQIGVGAGNAVEKLPKDHSDPPDLDRKRFNVRSPAFLDNTAGSSRRNQKLSRNQKTGEI